VGLHARACWLDEAQVASDDLQEVPGPAEQASQGKPGGLAQPECSSRLAVVVLVVLDAGRWFKYAVGRQSWWFYCHLQ